MFRSRVVEHYRARGYRVREAVKVRGRSGTVHHCDLVAEGPLGALVVSFGDESDFEGPELGAVRRAAQDIGAAPVAAAPFFAPPLHAVARQYGVNLLDEAALDASDSVGRAETAPEALDHPWPDPELPPARTARGTVARSGNPPGDGGHGAVQLLWKHPKQVARQATEPSGQGSLETARLDAPAAPSASPAPTGRAGATASATVGPKASFGWLRGEADNAPSRRTAVAAPAAASTRTDLPVAFPDAMARAPAVRTPSATEPERPRHIVHVTVPRTSSASTRRAFPWRWVVGPVLYGVVTGLVLFLFAALFL